jgi:thioredoxin-related protein
MLARAMAMALLVACTSWAADEAWMTDFEAAKAKAKEKNLPILIDFSGSDWCGWCIKLDKEVFSQTAFKTYAAENLVLMLADFPRSKEQTPQVKEQNTKLQKQFGIRGFPTVVLVDAEGKELARTGYKPGGPDAYVKHLQGLLGVKKDAPAKPQPE